MPGYREPTPEELESSRDARVARQQLDRLEIAVHHLEQAARLRAESNQPPDPRLNKFVQQAQDQCVKLREKCTGRVESRRRPTKQPSAEECTVYLDECGQHALSGADPFPVFVLSAVIVRKADEQVINAKWKQWKHSYLGSDAIVHEPDIRHGRVPFQGEQGERAAANLPAILRELDFAAMAVVVNRSEYIARIGSGPLDASLPDHVYLMALDFLMERLVFVLDKDFGGARAVVIAESRGPKEDALLQHEFSRLHLDGTSYVSAGWFRQQLDSGLLFHPKTANMTGLQLADLLARPIGEKVGNPTATRIGGRYSERNSVPAGRPRTRSQDSEILPWHERYEDIWKS